MTNRTLDEFLNIGVTDLTKPKDKRTGTSIYQITDSSKGFRVINANDLITVEYLMAFPGRIISGTRFELLYCGNDIQEAINSLYNKAITIVDNAGLSDVAYLKKDKEYKESDEYVNSVKDKLLKKLIDNGFTYATFEDGLYKIPLDYGNADKVGGIWLNKNGYADMFFPDSFRSYSKVGHLRKAIKHTRRHAVRFNTWDKAINHIDEYLNNPEQAEEEFPLLYDNQQWNIQVTEFFPQFRKILNILKSIN